LSADVTTARDTPSPPIDARYAGVRRGVGLIPGAIVFGLIGSAFGYPKMLVIGCTVGVFAAVVAIAAGAAPYFRR
jgi:hypothetical protein